MAMTDSTYQELANLEVAPDAELVIGVDLSDGHPFMVGAHSSKLPVGEARAGWGETASSSGVITIGSSSLPSLVGDFMVVLGVMSLGATGMYNAQGQRTLHALNSPSGNALFACSDDVLTKP